MNLNLEETFSIIKPNITKKNRIGEVINFWERRGLRIKKIKMIKLKREEVIKFYDEHREKDFFESMVDFMCSWPVVILILEGKNAIKLNRKIIGNTDPFTANEDTIRKKFGESIEANAVHGSDSYESFIRELSFFSKYFEDV